MDSTRDFDSWLTSFKVGIANYEYYTDFGKAYGNVDDIKVELNILNSLIGEVDVESSFRKLIDKYPEVLKCIPILLAVRAKEIRILDVEGEKNYHFDPPSASPEAYVLFMRETGLFDLLSNHIISDLVDYTTGVEVGLDSNARKNRGGHLMEDLVESYLDDLGVEYHKEMNASEIEKQWGLNLSELTNNGKTVKRFDFVVKANGKVYGIETNFYGSSGSKLNETARSYKTLALEARGIEGFEFVWITDGIGWRNARGNLRETFEQMDYIYNISELESGALSELFS